jgi:hypothetical protein
LYLLHAGHAERFTAGGTPQWVADWLAGPRERREKKEEKSAVKSAAQTPEEAANAAAQARKREDKREQNIVKGLAELQTWLEDLARDGLATVRERGPSYWETIAARMVDAQAGGLAARLRRISGLCFQSFHPEWEEQLSGELASIYMLSHAYGLLDRLPPALQCDVRTQIVWTVAQEDVLAQPAVPDCWQVLAQYATDEGRLRTRATWLRGRAAERWALLLHYAAGGQDFDVPLPAAMQFDAELCFYPIAFPLRALIRDLSGLRSFEDAQLSALRLYAALDGYAAALAAHPSWSATPCCWQGPRPCRPHALQYARWAARGA